MEIKKVTYNIINFPNSKSCLIPPQVQDTHILKKKCSFDIEKKQKKNISHPYNN
jgi:hypothetical protein